MFFPTSCSSNVSTNECDPIVRSYPSAFPPSKGTPSTEPSKSMLAISPSSIALSVTLISLALFSLSLLISSSIASFVALVSRFSTSTPLYLPSFTGGLIATVAVKINGCSSQSEQFQAQAVM